MPNTFLGKQPNSDAQRDATHVAVVPIVAAERVFPGEHVGLVEGTEKAGPCSDPIGIVDPFLTAPVASGERFYLCLYPESVTDMQHRWSHPSFPAVTAGWTLTKRLFKCRKRTQKTLERLSAEVD